MTRTYTTTPLCMPMVAPSCVGYRSSFGAVFARGAIRLVREGAAFKVRIIGNDFEEARTVLIERILDVQKNTLDLSAQEQKYLTDALQTLLHIGSLLRRRT